MTCQKTSGDRDPLIWQRQLLGRLGAASFPHAVERISLIETHISFVILTGHFAYKIKKALALGFLDFSTLARRRFYCQEELRLNRRLAAPLYLDVVAIGGSVEEPLVGAASPVLEYAVRMVEFAQESLFDRLLIGGQLAASDFDALAQRLAAFHHRLPPAQTPEEQDYGTPAAVLAPMEDNFAELRRLNDTGEQDPLLDQLEDWSRRQFAARQAVFASRRNGGFVRECHGDLHLGNIARLADGPCVFDGIEFNPTLRWIDVINEIAFLVMDLAERGRPDLAFRFLNAYLEQSGDYAGLALLPFYLVYRAMVRAKVARIRAAQPSTTSAERAAALRRSQDYLSYAQQAIGVRPQAVIITHGFAGSGKTHASQQLLEAVPVIRLRSDVERKRLHGMPPLSHTASGLAGGIYGASASAATYAQLAVLARSVLAAGFSVIVDACFLQAWQRDLFRQLASDLDLPLLIIDCAAPVAELYRRIAQRQQQGSDASEATAEVLAHQMASAQALAADEIATTLPAAISLLRPAVLATAGELY